MENINDTTGEVAELTPEQKRAEVIKKCGLTVSSVFIPFSVSRNAKEKHKTINWRITLLKNGVPVLLTDYSAGVGHAPFIRSIPEKFRYEYHNYINMVCEDGKGLAKPVKHNGTLTSFISVFRFQSYVTVKPNAESVIYSLLTDSDALNYSSFEDWAGNLGYETDSRSAEKIYRACMEIALQLRSGVGDKCLAELREAFQDY